MRMLAVSSGVYALETALHDFDCAFVLSDCPFAMQYAMKPFSGTYYLSCRRVPFLVRSWARLCIVPQRLCGPTHPPLYLCRAGLVC